jgi:hypothetical protein
MRNDKATPDFDRRAERKLKVTIVLLAAQSAIRNPQSAIH